LSARVFELEGSEEFVSQVLPQLADLLTLTEQVGVPSEITSDSPESGPIPSGESEGQPRQDRRTQQPKKAKNPVTVPPVPINLKGLSGGPSLREFFDEKAPSKGNHQEVCTVFVYYLTRHGGVTEVTPGLIVSCYNEMGLKKPTNIPQVLSNIKARKAWLESSKTRGTFTVTVTGENFVEHDLPSHKPSKK
jgi:hypothetical protein